MPFRTCPACKQGLHGIEGHKAIVIDSGTPDGPRYRGSVCGTHWQRMYIGQGAFHWSPEDAGDSMEPAPKN